MCGCGQWHLSLVTSLCHWRILINLTSGSKPASGIDGYLRPFSYLPLLAITGSVIDFIVPVA
jgi:hypothetical protein